MVPTLLLITNYRTFQDPQNVFQDSIIAQKCSVTDKQQLLTLYIQCDSTIHCKTFIISCTETVWFAHGRNASYIYLHMVFYT